MISYAAMLERMDEGRTRETNASRLPQEMREIEVQAHWFAGDFGRHFTTTDGETVEIISPGVWNHEAGPDFTGAAVKIGNAAPVAGAVEVDPDVRDWERHGHAENSAYESVALHIFLAQPAARHFTRTRAGRNVPQVHLKPELLEGPAPLWLPDAKPGRCLAPLRETGPEQACALLESAASYRLNRKRERILRSAEAHGMDEALYQALATALGYRENKLPFQLLAQRLTLVQARKLSVAERTATLFGLAGFLKEPNLAKLPEDSRAYVRELWESWWQKRDALVRLTLTPDQWSLGGLRPVNHPQRRLAALAAMARAWKGIRAAMDGFKGEKFRQCFEELQDDFWNHHYTLTSRRSEKPLALVGEARVRDIEANIFYPLAVAEHSKYGAEYRKLPAAQTSRRVLTAAARLFGPGAKPFLSTVARQQGLLQIYEDFCARDLTDCEQCPFPELVRGHGAQ